MKENRFYKINKDSKVHFNNKVDFCVGTGRMGLALQKEYQEQLKLIQEEIGFRHIRGHGLFSDDMAIGAGIHAGSNGLRGSDGVLLEGKCDAA